MKYLILMLIVACCSCGVDNTPKINLFKQQTNNILLEHQQVQVIDGKSVELSIAYTNDEELQEFLNNTNVVKTDEGIQVERDLIDVDYNEATLIWDLPVGYSLSMNPVQPEDTAPLDDSNIAEEEAMLLGTQAVYVFGGPSPGVAMLWACNGGRAWIDPVWSGSLYMYRNNHWNSTMFISFFNSPGPRATRTWTASGSYIYPRFTAYGLGIYGFTCDF